MMYKKLIVLLSTSCLLMSVAHADINAELDRLCEKVEQCAIAEMQLENQELPPAMRDMMIGMAGQMCKKMVKPHYEAAKGKGLGKQVSACLKSINTLSCDQIKETQDSSITPECTELEKAAKEAGLDTDINSLSPKQ